MDVKELFSAQEGEQVDFTKVISELKSKRFIEQPVTEGFEKQLDPMLHDVCDIVKRPNKKVKVDPAEAAIDENVINVTAGTAGGGIRYEPVARVALAIQKLIVKRAVSFMFGNAVTLDCTPESENEKAVLKALKRIMYDAKEKSLNRKVARNLFSSTEVAELWYPVESKNNTYGFDSKFKLRCAVFSPLNGDTLYPYFDETGDMTAFSREFILTTNGKSKTYFESYTAEKHYMWSQGTNGYEIEDGFPKDNIIGKIPVVFGNQEQVEWADVQNLIDRLEKLLSNFADTNDYHASPKIVVKGEVTGFSKKGETGAILQLEGDGASASYLSWQDAPAAVQLEINTLLKMIWMLTQTADISFDSIKGLNVSGIALKFMFMDAHLKVADHQEVFDEYLQRRLNIVKAFIGKFSTKLAADADNLMVEPVITPYMIRDEAAELKIWSDANGGNAVISQQASFSKAALTHDPEADFTVYKAEQSAANSFLINEPTQV